MTGLGLGLVGAYGVFLAFSAAAFGWRGLRWVPRPADRVRVTLRARPERWMRQAGLGVSTREFAAAVVVVAAASGAVGSAIFGGVTAPLALVCFGATVPVASYRLRRATRIAAANEAWPQMIEEIRVLTSAAGRSIPQALLDVGRRGPDELRDAFEAAHREWMLSTDFERTVAVITTRLADATADATCETLLVAHEVGGADLDRRLAALAEDRRADNLGRKDARSKQAGVRFARRFVICVPLGMALAGMSLGDGRAAYATASGQVLVAVGLTLVAGCWAWSGSMLRPPRQDRVFG